MILNDIICNTAPLVMGIINTTPDSFSDGGNYMDPGKAIAHGLRLLEEGAQILDIGGESTRPGALPISPEDEIGRIVPVIEGLRGAARYISVDTRHAKTMLAALTAGANIINDISALSFDPDAVSVAAQSGAPVCLMHMQGEPQSMQDDPFYENVVEDIQRYFDERMAFCIKNGVKEEQIILDIGIGFGKNLEHNLCLLKNIDAFRIFGRPLLLGCSRKRFIAELSGGEPAQDRLGGSIAAALWGAQKGVEVIRVHDVAQTVQAVSVYTAIAGVSSGG